MNDTARQLREVVTLLHEEGVAGDTVEWKAAAAGLGVASFPPDYREFVAAFGAGSLEDSLFLSIPRLGNPAAPLTVGRIRQDVLQNDSMNDWQDPRPEPRPALEDMLIWGETNGADALCWVTSHPDPDRWPVAVWASQDGGWALYECGMTEFVLRVLQGDFERCPLSVTTLWGRGTARFLNFREEERLLDEGVDPWTGGSTDPFAGL
ncbi:hypothetical protein ACWD25_09835 [Streptomyces sp. NPDC002920]